jgi:hypothetical protein
MLREFSVRLRTTDAAGHEYHFIVPVRAGSPEHAEGYARRFIADFYGVTVTDCIVRFKGCSLPTWCRKAQRVDKLEAGPRHQPVLVKNRPTRPRRVKVAA